MHAHRNGYPRSVDRYTAIRPRRVLVVREAKANVVHLRWPVADAGPADDPTAPGVDGTPQSISPGAFAFVLSILIGAGFAACADVLAGILR